MGSSLAFPSLLLSVGALCAYLPLSRSDPGWVSLSLVSPNELTDNGASPFYYANDVMFGTPPSSGSLILDITSSRMGVSSTDCAFCPGTGLFDPGISSTYQATNISWSERNSGKGGHLAEDTVSFGGILTSGAVPLTVVDWMSSDLEYRFANGHLGLWVDPVNDTAREQHILTHLHSSGQLLNPVIGLRMGRTSDTSRITIGALDPNDLEGTINWSQAETPDPSWDGPSAIKVDGFRGYNGSLLPYQNPFVVYLSNLNTGVNLPDANKYMSQSDYTGPVNIIFNPEDHGIYAYNCNNTGAAYVHLSVDINGVNYQIDSQDNLLQNNSFFEPPGDCKVALYNLTTTAAVKALLGVPFFRSVYFAYRFPTPDCPRAYYGSAYQKGANRTSYMIAQQPRSTPSASAQCLSFSTPTSTPTVSTPPPQRFADAEGAYSVWGHPEADQVKLIGVEDLKAGIVSG